MHTSDQRRHKLKDHASQLSQDEIVFAAMSGILYPC
jgi:hypothetical protein